MRSVPAPIQARTLSRLRVVFILNFVLLVLVRLLRDADDFNNWDLISFLNANAFASLGDLLRRPEVHFPQLFSFPLYNVGAESALSVILHRLLGHISLYWSNVIVLLVYDAIFLTVIYSWFRILFRDRFLESVAWLLLSMSPVVLTFASTSAFNMQGFTVLALGLLGAEFFLQQRFLLGTLLLALAFCFVAQGYPLSFFLPLYCLVWVIFRTVARRLPVSSRGLPGGWVVRVARAGACLLVTAALVGLVNLASGGTYARKLSETHPRAPEFIDSWPASLHWVTLFLQQSFWPARPLDGVRVGFAPYCLYAVLGALLSLWLVGLFERRRLGRGSPDEQWGGVLARLLVLGAWVGLVVFGYLPGFVSNIVKSQRTFFGDLFFVIGLVYLIHHLWERGIARPKTVLAGLGVLLCVSNGYYLSVVSSIDHQRDHRPVFDFDMSDGVVRHRLIRAIETMKRQEEEEGAGLVIYYPRGYLENTTDPAMFFARFLRHFGRYDRPDVIFPCHWCNVRYGCPFPDVGDRQCGSECCYEAPAPRVATTEVLAGKPLYVWWYNGPQKPLKGVAREVALGHFGKHYTMRKIRLPPGTGPWDCYELRPKGPWAVAPPKRGEPWTARQRAALVMRILQGLTSVGRAARVHGLPAGEVADWRQRFLRGAEAALQDPLETEPPGGSP